MAAIIMHNRPDHSLCQGARNLAESHLFARRSDTAPENGLV